MTLRTLICWLAGLMACGPSENSTVVSEPPIAKKEQQNYHQEVRMQIGQMADSLFSSAAEFAGRFDCYLVAENGNKTPVADTLAIDRYLQIIDHAGKPLTELPVFELKSSDRVVLLVKEKKAWAHVLLDRNSLNILDIRFPRGSLVAGLGSNTDKFREQIIGSMVSFSPDNFELTPWDDQQTAKGDVVIDGISGATKICQASVDMLNNHLPFYRNYLQQME